MTVPDTMPSAAAALRRAAGGARSFGRGPAIRCALLLSLAVVSACRLPEPVTSEQVQGPQAPWGGVTSDDVRGPHAPWGEATAEGTRMWSAELDPDGAPTLKQQLEGAPPLAATHGAASRSRGEELSRRIQALLSVALPRIEQLQTELSSVVGALTVPERLATNEPALRTWRSEEREQYREQVSVCYAEAERRLASLHAETLAAGQMQAQTLALPASALDAGLTGDPALDLPLVAFEEVLDGAVALNDLSVRRNQDLVRRVDLFETFSSFGRPEEVALGGRLLLFVGGDETERGPRAVVVFRSDTEAPAEDFGFRQVSRHRILRGPAIVADLGWRPAPVGEARGRPATEVIGNFLLGADVEPLIDRNAPGFDQLRDMRVVADIQTAVVDRDERVLGGVDWRIEFTISSSGAVTWQLAGGAPVFDPGCREVVEQFGLTPVSGDADEDLSQR